MLGSRSGLIAIALVVLVGSFTAFGLDRIESRQEAQTERAFMLERARSEANHIRALEWRTHAEGAVSAEALWELDAAAVRLRAAVDGALPDEALRTRMSDYLRAIEAEFALIADGAIEDAEEFDHASVGPAFEAMMNAMTGSIADSRGTSEFAQAIVRFTTVSIVILSMLAIIGLLWFVDRSNGLAQQVLEVDAQRKTEFVALASHELRTPLTAIVGFSELLLGSENLTGAERGFAAHVHAEGQRLTRITSDLLNVARIDAGHAQFEIADVDLRDVVDTVLRSQMSPRHTIEASFDGAPVVRGNHEKLVEVLGNLVENAVKYSPNGGRVSINWELVDRRRVRISVSDQGLGIPEAEITRLFTRFHRIERAEHANIRSTGLGLYLVQELVTGMGGSVGAESVLGHGSTFWFTLPSRQVLADAA